MIHINFRFSLKLSKNDRWKVVFMTKLLKLILNIKIESVLYGNRGTEQYKAQMMLIAVGLMLKWKVRT